MNKSLMLNVLLSTKNINKKDSFKIEDIMFKLSQYQSEVDNDINDLSAERADIREKLDSAKNNLFTGNVSQEEMEQANKILEDLGITALDESYIDGMQEQFDALNTKIHDKQVLKTKVNEQELPEESFQFFEPKPLMPKTIV